MKGLVKVWDIVLLGLHSLTVHKVRSGLTMLGIICGVCCIIMMLAISEGSSYESQLTFRELGSDNIIISSVKPPAEESKATAQQRGIYGYGLTDEDVVRLRSNVPGVVRCVTVHRAPRYVRAGSQRMPVDVYATEPDFVDVARIQMSAGRFIAPADVLPPAQAHCVLAAPLARKLFPCEDPLGQEVLIGSRAFTVVGVLDRLPAMLAGESAGAGNYAVVPLETSRGRFGRSIAMFSRGNITFERVEVSQVVLQMADEQAVMQGAGVARSLLERYHDSMDYQVKVPVELLEQRRRQDAIWKFVFASIASVSLVVGGIGIMNIMLASITERTREIGIRRALGAKRRDILVQFLVESTALTVVGGAVGMGIGLLGAYLVQKMLGKLTIVLAFTLLVPFIMSVAVGLISGLYPAIRAARLDPIVALRHE